MHIITGFADIVSLKEKNEEVRSILDHIESIWDELIQALEPSASAEKFSLKAYGFIVILEDESEMLEPLGCDYPLEEAWPDFVMKIEIERECYYKIGLLESNDYLPLVFVNKKILSCRLDDWLNDIVEETSEDFQ